MVCLAVGLISLGVLRGETRFNPRSAVARAVLRVLSMLAFVIAALALVLAVA